MGLKPEPSYDKEMKTIPSSAIILLLVATSLAEPLRVNVNCRGQGTSCNGSFSEGSSDNSSYDAECSRGSSCNSEVRERGQAPSDKRQYFDNSQTTVNNNCRNRANCDTNVFGKRDVVAALKAFGQKNFHILPISVKLYTCFFTMIIDQKHDNKQS